jgi:tetratricopeptide (TPR) repeat protein
MMSTCASPGCLRGGIHRCSICLRELYCSGECQKGDWKLHKLICKTLKKFSCQLQPYQEVARVIEEIVLERPTRVQLEVRLLRHLISFAEHQFGDRVPGKTYRERGDGDRMDNWLVEIVIFCSIYIDLVTIFSSDDTLSNVDSANLRHPCYDKILDLLRPWSACLDSNSTSRVDCLDKDQINYVLRLLSTTECNIGGLFRLRNEFILAESYCQQALSYARLCEWTEEKKTDLVCEALRLYQNLLVTQGKYGDALPFAEEACNLVAIAYNPVHPKVQKAAGTLIECLMHKDNLYNAERFAEATLDSLRDPANGFDQESEAVARGYYDLANVLSKQQGDFRKAEKLGRESLRIRTRIYNNDHRRVGLT